MKAVRLSTSVVFVVNCLIATTLGSAILLETTPASIHAPLTPRLTLRCSLNDTQVSSAIIGRDVSQTVSDVHHVSSIVVVRNFVDHVASVSTFAPATALVDQDSLSVTGDLTSGKPGEEAFLQLTWDLPTEAQAGSYQCEINALDDHGHIVVYSQIQSIDSITPTIKDLVPYLHDMQVKVQEVDELKVKIQQVDALRVQEVAALNLKIQDLEARQKHVESGIIQCHNSSTWKTQGNGMRDDNHQQQFTTPYSEAPTVHLSVVYYVDDQHYDTRYYAKLKWVGKTGFSMGCQTWRDSEVNHMYVSWVSFSN